MQTHGSTFRLCLLIASMALSSNLTQADVITGQVVDVNGVGVPGVDIDVKNLGSGGDPILFNDGTDANGFFTTTLPAGIYRVFFKPPPPPVTTHLTAIVDDVLVIGTTDMGVITLPPGVGLTGRVIDTLGFPLANVDLDVTDLATGDQLVLKDGKTDIFGMFGVAVPTNDIHLDFDPITVVGRTLVPLRMDLSPTADQDLGDITLQEGVVLSGTLHNSVGTPVSGVDLDVFETLTGTKIFTPHDNSSTLGLFSVVLAPGLYDVEICPPFSTRLVARDEEGLLLLADTDVGIITLIDGVVLSGIIRDIAGFPVAGMDVDVAISLVGSTVVTCNDNSNASGNYAVIVPPGTLDVGFAPPGQHGGSAEDLQMGVVVSGDTLLDGTIPAPLALFLGTPLGGFAPLTVAFTDLSTGAVTGRSWSFGDTGTSTLPNPVHVYTSPGVYDVSLTADGVGGPSTHTEVGYINVQAPLLTAAFAGTPRVGTAPLSVTFTDQSTGAISTWSWDFGDLAVSNVQNPTHVYANPGTYTVSLTVTGPSGSSTHTELDYVAVGVPAPAAEFSGTPLGGTAPLTVAFTDLSTGPVTSRAWDFGDLGTSTLQSPVHTYANPGTYTVSLTATGPGGSNTNTKLDYITVTTPGPVADFVGTPLSGTAPLTVAFTDLTSGAVTSWAWDFGDLSNSATQNPEHTYTTPGIYDISLTAGGPGGTSTVTRSAYVLVRRSRIEKSDPPTSLTSRPVASPPGLPIEMLFRILAAARLERKAMDSLERR